MQQKSFPVSRCQATSFLQPSSLGASIPLIQSSVSPLAAKVSVEGAYGRRVYDFLKKCGTYYLATVEGDQPRVRPFGTIDLFENRLHSGKWIHDITRIDE